jgi:plasmid stabilization system protein ParE
MRQYYEIVFSGGRLNAQKQFHAVENTLMSNPFIGHETHRKSVREFSIPKTPFSYIYRAFPDRIEVLRVWDERQDRSKLDE